MISKTNDLISRQWLIECVAKRWIKFDTERDENIFIYLVRDMAPSILPEPLTDREQRIFLAAMRREEKICKQVDNEYKDYNREHKHSLVKICDEITRKVKGALWTS